MDFEELTWREQEILWLLAKRLTNREIADQLHLAESTVKDYVSNILGKLFVKNRRQAVERAEELGLLARRKTLTFEPQTSLPAETTPFIGRLHDREQIRELLGETRLLTLTGPGGIGKTRLALQAAAELAADFADGSFFVSLAPIQSTDDIIQAVAEVVGAPLSTDEEPRLQLLRYLRNKQLLLVLDNYEHLIQAAGLATEILTAAPRVKVLATSRERLNLLSETTLKIGGLDLPTSVELAASPRHDAIALFVQSARQVRPEFEPAAAELKQIAAICRSVQGMPLAIVLAAAWLHILSLDEIAGELGRSLDFLAHEVRDAPARHHSIRAVFDHTWSLLSQAEQGVFQRLALFRGGFTREAAQQIAAATLSQLGTLVNKSILSYEPESGRFDIHELLRQYAQEKLQAMPEVYQATRRAYAAYFAGFMDARWEHLKDQRQVAAIDQIEADLENIRAAWRYFVEQADAPQLEKFIHSFWLVYWIRGWNQAAVELFGRAAQALRGSPSDTASRATQAVLKAHQGFFMTWLGLADQGYRLARESIETLERLAQPRGLYFAYHSLTLSAFYLDRSPEERDADVKMLEIARDLNDRWLTAFALFLYAIASFRLRDYAEAKQLAEAGLKLSAEIGELFVSLLCHNTLGHLATFTQAYAEAKDHYLRSLSMAQAIGFHWAFSNAAKYLGQVMLFDGQYAEAEMYFVQSLEITTDLGLDRDVANHLYEFARLRAAQGREREAVELLALLLQQPTSYLARLGSGTIRDSAQALLARLEETLTAERYAAAVERGRTAALDVRLAELLNSVR